MPPKKTIHHALDGKPIEVEEPVGITEIADRLGVELATVHQWRYRDVLPEPDWIVSGRPVWRWSTIREWAIETGRLER